MKKLMVSMFALAAMASSAMAAEPLTTAQLDQVTAAGFQLNFNSTRQWADATAVAIGGCSFCKNSGNAAAQAVASNSNVTGQANVD